MKKLTLIIPILNEINTLPTLLKCTNSYSKKFTLIFCDGGSTDGSQEFLIQNLTQDNYKYVSQNLANPSLLATIELAIPLVTEADYIMIHPADANCAKALKSLIHVLDDQFDYYLFHKKYFPTKGLLDLQAIYLNWIRLNFQKQFVWTNCPVMKNHIFQNIVKEKHGFLEDVILSDHLKKEFKPLIVKEKVIISSRRYIARKTIKQMFRNFSILLFYRLKTKTISELKRIYYQ